MSNDAAVSPAYERYARTTHFGPLDGLRALAVILVMRNHIDLHGAVWELVDGSRGVPIFFVLSGYLITTLALREERRRGSVDLGAFYWRRSMRIFPAYYAVLALYCVIVFANLGGQAPKRDALAAVLPYYLTYMNEYAPDVGAPFGQSWTLGIEEKFYLVWPAVAFALLRARGHLRLGIAVVAATACFVVAGNHLTFHYACILLGCVLSMVLDSPRGFAVVGVLARPPVHHAVLIGFVVFQVLPSAFELRRSPLYHYCRSLVVVRDEAWG
jgi:peptidoglycan/LPS O-acetylase OafA/YrhL